MGSRLPEMLAEAVRRNMVLAGTAHRDREGPQVMQDSRVLYLFGGEVHMYALVKNEKVISVTNTLFDIPAGYELIECPDNVVAGMPYENGQFIVQGPTLDELKQNKLEAVKTAFLAASETAHCMSSVGFEIDANETANRDINGLIVVMEARGKETELFRAYDNTFHEVTLDDLKTMLVEISEHGQKLYARKWQLEVSIQAATTAEELDAITITFEGVDVASTGGYVD